MKPIVSSSNKIFIPFNSDKVALETLADDGASAHTRKWIQYQIPLAGAGTNQTLDKLLGFLDRVERIAADEFFRFISKLLNISPDL